MATTGATLIEVLMRVHRKPFSTKSDYAREQADLVAMSASEGHVSTKIATGLYGNWWYITAKGLTHLERYTKELNDE